MKGRAIRSTVTKDGIKNPNMGRALNPQGIAAHRRTAIPLVLMLTALVTTARANLIQNGSFEGPTLTADGIYQYISPTSWAGGGYFLRGNNVGWPSPQNGQQYLDLADGYADTILQSFNVVTPGTYNLTWFDNSYFFAPSTYVLGVSIGGSTSYFTGTGGPTWTSRSITMNLSAGLNTLLFTGDGHALIDNVVLEAAGTGVPDSGNTLAILGAAIMGLLCLKRPQPVLRCAD